MHISVEKEKHTKLGNAYEKSAIYNLLNTPIGIITQHYYHIQIGAKSLHSTSHRRLGIPRSELQRHAVNTVAFIRRRTKPFSFEDMTKMSTAGCTCDLYPPSIRISLYTVSTIVRQIC